MQSGCSFRSWPVVVVGLALSLTVAAAQLTAQDSNKQDSSQSDGSAPAKNTRKLVHKVPPVYPQDLRSRNIGGIVKLDVKIGASGNVEKVAIIGGNPILADSAARAVKQWQYAPSGTSTSLLLNLEFNPTH